ncbi:hypothetical protein OIU77_020080 [Salix suchowensis]|uniref:Uncharacterized protein n=1 Tax=Salix suchowensis TaxID=1278906 RepID=A0ABQ9CIK7_9ROSI|nr:hypothetical protein OIU77_020080 [Salix suchowensis]
MHVEIEIRKTARKSRTPVIWCWLQINNVMAANVINHFVVGTDNLFVCFFVHVSAFWPLFFGPFLDHEETCGDGYQKTHPPALKTEKLVLMRELGRQLIQHRLCL